MIPSYSQEDRKRIGSVVRWAERQQGSFHSPMPSLPNQQSGLAIRGYLLQNIYGNGSGIMALAYRSESSSSFQVSIVGTNYVPESKFKLAVSGTLASDPLSQPADLFTTQPILAASSSGVMQQALLLAAQGQNLPVTSSDISIQLGNPLSVPELIFLDPLQPDVVLPDLSYVGSWIITFGGALTRIYDTLYLSVLQDTAAYMHGLSGVVSRQVVDIPGTTRLPVFDVQNRPVDYPWVAGSLCGAVWYPDLGYGITWSDFREQSISIPSS